MKKRRTARRRGQPPFGAQVAFARVATGLGWTSLGALERVMNSIRNALGMRETEIAREPRRSWNPHFYAVFAQVHNTL
jgi:hypothetical protein